MVEMKYDLCSLGLQGQRLRRLILPPQGLRKGPRALALKIHQIISPRPPPTPPTCMKPFPPTHHQERAPELPGGEPEPTGESPSAGHSGELSSGAQGRAKGPLYAASCLPAPSLLPTLVCQTTIGLFPWNQAHIERLYVPSKGPWLRSLSHRMTRVFC